MRRRAFLAAAGGGLFALIGAGSFAWSRVPVIPKRPDPDAETAIGWIGYRDGRYTLSLPRAEIGQNISTGLKQIVCAELQAQWSDVDVLLHDTTIARVKPTVGSESVMLFAEPLAQACASLRDAIASGTPAGQVQVKERPRSDLRAFRPGGLIGASPQLEHGRAIVTGAPLYAADTARPGMRYGRVLRAPGSLETRSRPARWDIEAARAVPGFVAVVDACGPPLGQAQGLGIVASRPGALDAIAEALNVEWDAAEASPGPDVSQTIDIDRPPSGHALAHKVLDGAPEDGPWHVDLRIDVPLAAHGAIEPRAAVAEWRGNRLRVWAGTQDAFYTRDVLADLFGLPDDAVTVQTCRVGGGFGGKVLCAAEAEAAALARAVSAPVKVQWTRPQEFAQAYHRPPSSHRIRARLRDGQITDWDHGQLSSHIFFTAAAVPKWMQRVTDVVAGDGGVARGMEAPYRLGRARAAYDVIRLPVHTGAWRGLGAGPNGLAIETAMDAAAAAAGSDPLDFRLAHVDDPALANVLTEVAQRASWGQSPPNTPGRRRGRGIACGIYKKTSYAAVVADVSVDEGGDVTVDHLWCVHDCGLVINPDQVRAQCEGNLVWGVGMVLSDTSPINPDGVPAASFADAPIPGMADLPGMTVELIHSDRAPQGAGETVMVAAPGAIANAITAATGRRPTRFPVQAADLAL